VPPAEFFATFPSLLPPGNARKAMKEEEEEKEAWKKQGYWSRRRGGELTS
jgi:hypothetical protein